MSLESRFDGQARMDRLAAIVAFIDSFCVLHGVDRRDALRLTLLVEELFTNTVRHGHRGDSDAPVQVALQVEPARVSLIYADTAPSFDPLAWLAQSGTTQVTAQAEPADRPVGQLGLHLVAQIATRRRYERSDGWNRLWLELDRQT